MIPNPEIVKFLKNQRIESNNLRTFDRTGNQFATDDETFFVKIFGTENPIYRIQVEHEAANLLPNVPKLINPNILEHMKHKILIYEYLKHTHFTLEDLTPETATELAGKLYNLHSLNLNSFQHLGKYLDQTNLIEKRLHSNHIKNLSSTQLTLLNKLLIKFVYPTDIKYNSPKYLKVAHGDFHIGNVVKTSNGVTLIDHEALKAAPIEYDLACFYNNIVQLIGNENKFQLFLNAYRNFNNVNEKVFIDNILFKNTLQTLFVLEIGNYDIVGERLTALEKSLKTGEPPERLKLFNT